MNYISNVDDVITLEIKAPYLLTYLPFSCSKLIIFGFLDPVTLYGEGEFNLNAIKEISVTESFLGLSQEAKGCQNTDTFNDCVTKNYIEKLRDKCGCLPLSSILSDQVFNKQSN